MIHYALFWMFAGAIALVILTALFQELTRVRDRTIDEVVDYIKPQSSHAQIDAKLFDPAVDEALRRLKVPVNFRRKQRMRFDLANERLRDKRHAIWVVVQWANTEWHDMHYLHSQDEYTDEALVCLEILRAKGKKFLWLMLVSMGRARLAKLLLRLDKLRLVPAPNVARLRYVWGVDLFQLYAEAREAAVCLALTYGEETSEELRGLL